MLIVQNSRTTLFAILKDQLMQVNFFFGANIDLFHFGRTLAGLYAQSETRIRLHRVDWIDHPLCAAIEVDGMKLALEVSDRSDFWHFNLLRWCDVYAKRDLNPLLTDNQHKIIPFGLNWACHSRRSVVPILAAIATTLPRASRARLMEVYRYLATPHWRAFEHSPEQPVDQTILFQTRVWEPSEAPGDEIVNDHRVGLLRALKREFGDRVVGGVVPTPFALKHYSDLITDQPCRQPQYVRWAKKPLIGIYFRGLFGSIAFKMAEFFAASKCIVSEPIHNVLTAPLDHIAIYKSNTECLDACERLLSDRSLASTHRRQSWKYYERNVRPEAHFSELLDRAKMLVAQQQSLCRSSASAGLDR